MRPPTLPPSGEGRREAAGWGEASTRFFAGDLGHIASEGAPPPRHCVPTLPKLGEGKALS